MAFDFQFPALYGCFWRNYTSIGPARIQAPDPDHLALCLVTILTTLHGYTVHQTMLKPFITN